MPWSPPPQNLPLPAHLHVAFFYQKAQHDHRQLVIQILARVAGEGWEGGGVEGRAKGLGGGEGGGQRRGSLRSLGHLMMTQGSSGSVVRATGASH